MEYTTLNSLTRKEENLEPIWKHHSFCRKHEYMASECMQKISDCHLVRNCTYFCGYLCTLIFIVCLASLRGAIKLSVLRFLLV